MVSSLGFACPANCQTPGDLDPGRVWPGFLFQYETRTEGPRAESSMKGKTLNSSSSLPEMCAKERASREVDRQSEDSFPASDPPSFSGGLFIGAPKDRHASRPAVAVQSRSHIAAKVVGR